MWNHFCKKLEAILLAAMLALGIAALYPVTVHAQTADLVTLEYTQDIVVILEYDSAEPKVTLIDPYGERYEADEDYALVQRDTGLVYYYIANAGSGTWQIDYEKGSNQKLNATVVPWHQSIRITDLSYTTEQEDDQTWLNVEYAVEYEKGSYRAILYAVETDADGNIQTQVQIAEDGGSGTGPESIRGSLNSVPDGQYHVMVQVYSYDGEVEVMNWFITEDSFTVSGNTNTGDAKALSVFADLTEGLVSISFADPEYLYGEQGLVVTQNGEILYENLHEEAGWTDSILMDPADGGLQITVNAMDRDGAYYRWTRAVAAAMPANVAVDNEKKTGSAVGVITYDAGEENYPARIILGDKSTDVNLNGSGTLQVPLENMQVNELTVQVESGDVVYQISERISVDRVAPIIDLFGVSGTIRTQENTVLFVGTTDPDAMLTCNGETLETDAEGAFSYEAALNDGENTFTFEATDPYGNASVRAITVLKGDTVLRTAEEPEEEKSGIPFVLIITALLAFFFLLVLMLTEMLVRRNTKEGQRPYKALAVLAAAFLVPGIYCLGGAVWKFVTASRLKGSIQGSALVEKLGTESASALAETLREQQEAGRLAILFLIAGIVLIAAAIGTAVLRKYLKNRKPAPPKPPKPKTMRPKTPKAGTVSKKTGRRSGDRRFCPYCGAENSSGGSFCRSCGKPLRKQQ